MAIGTAAGLFSGLFGAVRQDRYGNVRRGDAVLMGMLSIAGVAGGVALANALSGAALRVAFAVPMLWIAAQLLRRAPGGEKKSDPMRRIGRRLE